MFWPTLYSIFQVRRNTILEDSYRQVHSIPSNKVDTLKTKLWIEFDGEVFVYYVLFGSIYATSLGWFGLWRRSKGVVLSLIQRDVQSLLRFIRMIQ